MTEFYLIYLFSFFGSWFYTRKLHSKGGKLEGLDVEIPEFIFTVVPVLNTITTLFLMMWWKENPDRKWLNKFFNVKK